VAITAALLVGLGFNPLYAAGLCLIVNTAPVAFGAMGIPILVAGQVTGIDSFAIGQMVGRQLPFLTIIVLFWIMAIMDGWRGIKETWPAVMVAGGSFAIAQYLSSNFLGPELPDIISSLVSLVCLTLFLKRWQPVRIFRFGDMGASQVDMNAGPHALHAGTGDPRLVAVPVPDRHRDPVERAAVQSAVRPGRRDVRLRHQYFRAVPRQNGGPHAAGGQRRHALRRGL
jgi:L-lactate permease